MRSATLFSIILAALGGLSDAHPEEYNSDLSKWEVVKRPGKADWDGYSSFFHRANYSDHEWSVDLVDAHVVARLKGDVSKRKTGAPKFDTTVKLGRGQARAYRTLKVKDGWIAAYNQGEFGAAVYWFSDDGKEKKKLSNHQINEFLVEGDRIFAVEGLAHLSMSEGSMIEIQKAEGGWEVVEFLRLPGAAEAIARVSKGDYVIVTTDMLLRVNLKKEVLILVLTGDWGSLYPNSIAVEGKFIYIGMRQFVARCTLSTSVQTFDLLVPDSTWLNTDTN